MRGKRVIRHSCIGVVLTRLTKEKNLTFRELSESTTIPKSTLFGFLNGVIPENPDVLILLGKYFKVSTDELLFGKDEDKEAMKEIIAKQEKEIKELSRQLAFFEIAERAM